MTPLLLLRQALRQRNLRIRAMLRFGRVRRAKFDPDQPRDDDGRWTDGGGGGGSDGGTGREFSADRANEKLDKLSKFHIPEDLQVYFRDKDMRDNVIAQIGNPVGAYKAFTDQRDVLENAMAKAGGFQGLLRKAESVEMKLSNLSSYQRYVNGHQVKHYIGKMGEVLNKEVAVVVKLGGRNWIVDGNHRTVAAMLGGAKSGTVKLIDLEK